MFSWKRGTARPAASPPRQRSMPIPLKDHQDATKLKNLSDAEQSLPEPSFPAPEFSRARSIKSVDSLRRIVGAKPATPSQPVAVSACHADDGPKPDSKAYTPPGDTASGEALNPVSSDQTSQSSSWSWAWFRGSGGKMPAQAATELNADKDGGAWGFWTRKSRPDAEDGDLAVSGTATEHQPRPAEVRPPSAKRLKPVKPSLLVPQFDTLPLRTRTDRWANLLWSAPPRMVRAAPTRVRKAVVIGVHGYFPAKMTRAILGEPTGTSLKFASEAERVVRQWMTANAPGSDFEIEQIALEGEGRINHRVESLYTLLLNWERFLREADFVFFAVHSQGAVVALQMVARLIYENRLSPRNQRVAILSMAGSLLGPMPGMDQTLVMKAITRIEHDSLIELFELQRPESPLSIALHRALASTLNAGVKVILVGSADDQLIPLYSALGVNFQHANLFRAVYFDGDDVSPTVAAPLLNIAAQQMNAGGTDHGIVRELSGPLAGALTSKGHSKLYSHDAVYELGVRVAIETAFVSGIDPQFDESFRIPKATANPYVLPWAAQALVNDALQNERLAPVVSDLLKEFDTWRPSTKPMKDLKWRLAGLRELVRSKL